ncbi:MAG: PBP1A family penicillin-binding protein [Acidobacteria bacterium]|nr:PBP1A family penicillin-binding protein [Acidobacteriota bacterium]
MRSNSILARPFILRLAALLQTLIVRMPRLAAGVAALVLVAQFAVIFGVPWAVHRVVADLPSIADVRGMGDMAQATVFYDVKDAPAFTIFEERRFEVALADVSPHLTAALIAIEDQRFRSHWGVDVVRIAGAMLANVRQGRLAQGGSTLTQQLARQSFLTLDKTYTRKIEEALLALRIERQYSKDQILELYLNKMYFGAGLYGIEAASLGYFGKPSRDLTLAEAALLAGLVKSPSTWAPTVNLERAVTRRNLVLASMREVGAIDEAAYAQAKIATVVLEDALRSDEPFGRYFKEQVRLELIERFGRERVYQSGLRVYTTIDVEMQKAAEAAVAKTLDELEARRQATLKARRKAVVPDDPPLQAAVVAIEPQSGAVRALVGGRSFADSRFNRAVQARRQPGSAFKTFVYAAALEAGYTPATLIEHLDEPIETVGGAWTPEDGHSDASEMTMRAALKISSNRAAVRMLEMIGAPAAVSYAGRLGLAGLPPVPSLALGSGEVTLFDMTSAYGAFAAEGQWHRPSLIRRVEDVSGNVLFTAEDTAAPAVTPETAFLMTSMLQDVLDGGTAWKARQLGFRLPAAGKTGTTNDYRDAWFVGYTKSLVSGVWVGYDTPKPILPGAAYAADVAVPLWARFMAKATANDQPEPFRPPQGVLAVQICRLSGKRPAGGCDAVPVTLDDGARGEQSMIRTEYFVAGSEPEESCHLHVGRSLLGRFAGWLSASAGQTARGSGAADTNDEPAAAATAPPPRAPEVAEAPAPSKKRGFWSRVFGRGGRDDEKKDDQKDPKKPAAGRPPG